MSAGAADRLGGAAPLLPRRVYSQAVVRHIFLWNVRRDVGSDASQRIIDALNMLRAEPVPARGWTLGADVPPAESEDSGGRWEFGLVSDYDSWEQLQAYYSTDEHAALVGKIVPLIADRAVCDFEV
jgi:hypothetical protein